MKKNYRKELFIHLQGIVLIPILDSLFTSKILKNIITKDSFCLDDIKKEKINLGYMNIALRILQSAKLVDLKRTDNEYKFLYTFTDEFYFLHKNRETINKFNELLYFHENFNDLNSNELIQYNNKINYCIDNLETIKNLNNKSLFINRLQGVLIGPILNNLGFYNFINQIEKENFSITNLDENFTSIIETIFISLDLIHIENENYKVTDKGIYFLTRLSSYGVTCSYIPTLRNMDKLLFGDCSFIWKKDINKNEVHINRAMNVWGSGGAHKIYFEKIDEIIISLFNKPLAQQPKAIVDVGCGDGTFLEHVYKIVKEKTLRGENLQEFPLGIIGIDINKAARIASRKKLNYAKIDNIIINGSINNPDEINRNLISQFKISLSECLNMRTFLDHNRIYKQPKHIVHKSIKTTGAFCYKGKLISNDELINNLIEHFSTWTPYIKKFGLILLELHTVDPKHIAENQFDTPSIAYDATHGFSDQYLIEHYIFEKCLLKAGLKLESKYQNLYPDKKNPTISINYIR